jgi:hypothetical protein
MHPTRIGVIGQKAEYFKSLQMGFNFFKMDKDKWPQPSTKVYREKIVEGFSIPAIIHNSQYFFVEIDVYEDGRVDCWNFEDAVKIASGFVVSKRKFYRQKIQRKLLCNFFDSSIAWMSAASW